MLINGLSHIKDRLLFVLFSIVVYRIGSHVPLPYIDVEVLQKIFQNGSTWSVFDIFAGGNLSRMTVFALGIMPYISASIIIQLIGTIIPSIEMLRKEGGENGIKQINQYTRYLTVLIAFIQGITLALVLEKIEAIVFVDDMIMLFRFLITFTLMGGTVFLMWLGEQINLRGIGEGISLIIFVGIVSELPSSIGSLFNLYQVGAVSTELVLFSIILAIILIALVVFVESSYRMILIQYPKHQAMSVSSKSSYLPIKLNISGAIPAIFASSLLLTITTIISSYAKFSDSDWVIYLSTILNRGTIVYLMLYVLGIVFFCFFYTAIVFNSENTANNLKQYGGFISGIRPGEQTANYLDYVITRITVIGTTYVSVICVIPELFLSKFNIPFFFLSGTAVLIVVNVVMDTINQIQSYMYSYQYENLFKKSKLFRKK